MQKHQEYSYITQFFLYCSGSSLSILKRTPSEINKHVGIGGTIFFTGLLATLSGGYALFSVFDNLWAAIGFGIVWGLMIFNLDRFIVSSMRKTNSFWKQFTMAIPRIILASILAVVISKPLELRIFQKEINKELVEINQENQKTLKSKIDSTYQSNNADLLREYNLINQTLKEKDSIYLKRQEEFDLERLGTKGDRTSGKAGYGPLAKEKEKQMNLAKLERDQYREESKSSLQNIQTKLDKLQSTKDTIYQEDSKVLKGYNGVAAQLHALSSLSKKEKAISIASTFIMLLFLILETAPIFVKLIAPKGPYDHLLQNHEHDFEVYNREKIAVKEHKVTKKIEELN
ncbi:hypothetical protein UJ101_01460 [Flavobacteriaceae bacterium UJ101]|nr:hypothetical protein UJ101_01460 [Flavobacteriaceae bacterium UJ101]